MNFFHGIPWNFEIVFLINTMLPLTCMEYSMELHGSLQSPNKKSSSSTGFHGIRRAPFQMTQVFHGIPWNIPWNSMELLCRHVKYHLVSWDSVEHSMEFHGFLVSPNEVSLSSMEFYGTLRLPFYGILPWLDFQGIFHGIPWNSGVARYAENFFSATNFKENRQLATPACITARTSRTCRDACRNR